MEYHGTWLHATRPVFFEHYGMDGPNSLPMDWPNGKTLMDSEEWTLLFSPKLKPNFPRQTVLGCPSFERAPLWNQPNKQSLTTPKPPDVCFVGLRIQWITGPSIVLDYQQQGSPSRMWLCQLAAGQFPYAHGWFPIATLTLGSFGDYYPNNRTSM